MTKNRKELKNLSIAILLFVLIDVIMIIINLCTDGMPQISEIPEGFTEGMVKAASIVTLILTFAVFIPQIYVGAKGIKAANGTAHGRAHIVWAVILAIFAGISVISNISNLTKVTTVDNALNLAIAAADLMLFALFFVYARKVAKEQ